MDRREAIKKAAFFMGGTLSASTLSVLLNSCTRKPEAGKGSTFTEDEQNIISRMADIIIPRTDTPGALEAEVPSFITMMLDECYPAGDLQQFHNGLAAFDEWCGDNYGKRFVKLPAEKQQEAVEKLDHKMLGQASSDDRNAGDFIFYYNLKTLTLVGFFTSEPGASETLRYMQVPGYYDGCIAYHNGEKAWAT